MILYRSDSDDSVKFAEVVVSGADILKGGEGAFTQSNHAGTWWAI